ncbi:hypothetical protein IFM89_005153, partial [Coptis chinensis]
MLLREFVTKYEEVVLDRSEQEISEDFDSRQTSPILKSRWKVEEEAAGKWTEDATSGLVIDESKIAEVGSKTSPALRYSELAHIALAYTVKAATTLQSYELGKEELMILLRKMDQCLQISDHGLFDKIASTHKESGGSHVEHNIRLKDPPCKKNKDHKYCKIKYALEKKKRTAKAQRNSRNGRRGPNTKRNKDDYAMADDGLHEVVVHTKVAQHGHPPYSSTEDISGVSNMTAYFVPYHTSQ